MERYILQLLLRGQGVLHENVLLNALINLYVDQGLYPNNANGADSNDRWTTEYWLKLLEGHINTINVKLNKLEYKILKISHPLGVDIVSKKYNYTQGNDGNGNGNDDALLDDNNNTPIPVVNLKSNKFYVYVNLVSNEETKLSTNFSDKEIQFIKWAIDQTLREPFVLKESEDTNVLVTHINRNILNESANYDGIKWTKYWTYTVPAKILLQYEKLTTMEIEDTLTKLIQLKWLYRTSKGRYGSNLRLIIELNQMLLQDFNLPMCPVCNQLCLQGVLCNNETCSDDENRKMGWHVDCYQHYVSHVSENCNLCRQSILNDSIFLI